MATREAAFTQEELAAMDKKSNRKATKKATKKAEAPKAETRPEATAETKAEAQTKAEPKVRYGADGLHALRGMSLMINNMLAMGCFTPEQIATCIIPYTRNASMELAQKKLTDHLRCIRKHGGNVFVTGGKYLACPDVVLPDAE